MNRGNGTGCPVVSRRFRVFGETGPQGFSKCRLWVAFCSRSGERSDCSKNLGIVPESAMSGWSEFIQADLIVIIIIIITIEMLAKQSLSHLIYPLTARVVGAPKMISQPVSSIFPRSPLPSGTWRTPRLSIPWCCLPTSSSVALSSFPFRCALQDGFSQT